MRRILITPIATLLLLAFALSARVAVAESSAIDVNTASAEELTSLRGIGEVKAAAIVDYRENHGAFKTVDDLKLVRGIGDKLLEQLRPRLTAGPAPDSGAPAPRHRKAVRH